MRQGRGRFNRGEKMRKKWEQEQLVKDTEAWKRWEDEKEEKTQADRYGVRKSRARDIKV